MRVHRPNLSVEGDRAVVSAAFESERNAFAPAVVSIGVPRSLAALIDLSATPWVPVAATLAAVLHEDVEFDAAVDPVILRSAAKATKVMAGWWGWGQPRFRGDPGPVDPGEEGRGHGLFFTRGMDSWASFLDLRDDPSQRSTTHLLAVYGVNDWRTPAEVAAVRRGIEEAATAVGVELVDIDTDVRPLFDPFASWELAHGAVLATCGLALGPLLDRLTIASSWTVDESPSWGSHADLDPLWGTSQVEVVHHLAQLDRVQKTAIVARDPVALASLHVCWEGGEATNCGRCPKCLRTMTGLHLVGALDRCPAFDRPLTAGAVNALADGVPHLDHHEFVLQLLCRLPPDHALAAAWRRHLDDPGTTRWSAGASTTPMTGPDLRQRVERDLAPTAEPVTIGWERGMVPLRPPLESRREILAATATNGDRTIAWVVAEPADPLRIGDPSMAALAAKAQSSWGAGLCYLSGIPWASEPGPILSTVAIGLMLDAARVRLWWRADGSLDPLRLIETLEHGCLPVQVMPAPEAALLRRSLPEGLTGLVVTLDRLDQIDPWACGRLLRAATSWVLQGSAERDLGGLAAHWPQVGLHA